MPAVNLPANEYMYRFWTQLDRRISALETQQNWAVRDSSMTIRVQGGLLPDGDFGVQITDVLGNVETLLTSVDEYVDVAATITSTTYVAHTGPTVTVPVGPSGKVFLEAAAYINTVAAGNTGGYVGLFIDGVLTRDVLAAESSASVAVASNVATKRSITGLSQGTHKFELRYKTTSGTSQFGARSLIVTPV